jgi:hypothetical protein
MAICDKSLLIWNLYSFIAHLTCCLHLRQYRIEQMTIGSRWSGLIIHVGAIEAFSWMVWGKSRTISVKISGSSAKILVTVWVNLPSEIRNNFSPKISENVDIRGAEQPLLCGGRKLWIRLRYETGRLVKVLGYGSRVNVPWQRPLPLPPYRYFAFVSWAAQSVQWRGYGLNE